MHLWKKALGILCACILLTSCVGAFAEDYTASAPGMGGDVADPWFTGDFEQTWRDVSRGCRALADRLAAEGEGRPRP